MGSYFSESRFSKGWTNKWKKPPDVPISWGGKTRVEILSGEEDARTGDLELPDGQSSVEPDISDIVWYELFAYQEPIEPLPNGIVPETTIFEAIPLDTFVQLDSKTGGMLTAIGAADPIIRAGWINTRIAEQQTKNLSPVA